ncbi:MAG: lytic transglycosylase domain-containing protein [Bacteroidales bacterium]|nr:lytic transglycosylase domain-containing protein [Bacteroidales bacterium]
MIGKERTVFRLVSALITVGLIFVFVFGLGFTSNKEEEEDPVFVRQFRNDYSIYSLNLPDSLSFAGERVPVDYFDVREALDRELLVNTYWQSHSLLLIKRANRYFPMIEDILEKNDIPEDFKYIPLIESELTHSISPAGAVGFWQFLEGTAKDYGLEVNSQVDERYNLEKSTAAACEFFKDAYEKFDSWTLAAAAFNFGRSAIDRQLKRQGADNYYNLILNEETARYLYRILSMKLILNDPGKYGFNLREEDLYYPVPYRKVKVDTTVQDFAEFAEQFSINYKQLKIMNPWLRENYLKNSRGKTYHIKIPKEGYRDYQKLFTHHKQ